MSHTRVLALAAALFLSFAPQIARATVPDDSVEYCTVSADDTPSS